MIDIKARTQSIGASPRLTWQLKLQVFTCFKKEQLCWTYKITLDVYKCHAVWLITCRCQQYLFVMDGLIQRIILARQEAPNRHIKWTRSKLWAEQAILDWLSWMNDHQQSDVAGDTIYKCIHVYWIVHDSRELICTTMVSRNLPIVGDESICLLSVIDSTLACTHWQLRNALWPCFVYHSNCGFGKSCPVFFIFNWNN